MHENMWAVRCACDQRLDNDVSCSLEVCIAVEEAVCFMFSEKCESERDNLQAISHTSYADLPKSASHETTLSLPYVAPEPEA